jgi:hypothetical protein
MKDKQAVCRYQNQFIVTFKKKLPNCLVARRNNMIFVSGKNIKKIFSCEENMPPI